MEEVCDAGCCRAGHNHEHADNARDRKDDGQKTLSAHKMIYMPEEEFTKIVGLVEDIFISDAFQNRHNDYFTQHCQLFSDKMDGSKPLETSELERLTREKFNVFRTYSVEMALFLETELKRSLGEKFEIDSFIQEIERRTQRAEAIALERAAASGGESPADSPRPGNSQRQQEEEETRESELIGIESEIFETLLTLKDYARFQELMIDYFKMKQGKITPVLEGLVTLRKISDDEAESV